MKERFDYGLNPEKCAVVSSHLCDPETAHLEFMLTKCEYQAETGRRADAGHLFYQIRQAFPHGEVTPEEANRIGYETAMRWTKGKYQFFVCTHTDKEHPHNHIYFCSTAQDCSRKFHNFWGSTFAVRRLSDRVCLEHGLSIVENPKQHSQGQYQHYGQWLEGAGGKEPSYQERLKAQIDLCLAEKPGHMEAFLRAMAEAGWEVKHGRGGVISFRTEGQKNYTRLRSSTLGEGYGQEDIRAIVEGRAPLPSGRGPGASAGGRSAGSSGRVNLIIDIQERMREGKGPAYERWAKVFNLKQMAAALQYLQEHDLLEYAALEQHTARAVDRFHDLAGQIQTTEAALGINAELRAATVDYAKTRPVFDGYKAARYSKKYLAEHEADIALHRSAQATFGRLLNGGRLPKMDVLRAEGGRLAAEKKSLYAQYRAAQKDMREAVAVKGNVDHLLGITEAPKNKEMTR
ncbi:MAG: relaxase/mobilization nuclease domain-containing protein [Clostridiales bacterium]|nr:relaxase/mobilization nuclease domain-containing protein [Clostridiales bacterium]